MKIDIELSSGRGRIELLGVELEGCGEQGLIARSAMEAFPVRLNAIGRIIVLTALPVPDDERRTIRWVVTEKLSPDWLVVPSRWDYSQADWICRVRLHA